MTAGLRGWLVSLIAASILCAAADALMPSGGPRRVGKLVCGLTLLCAVLSPLSGLDLEGSVRWLEEQQEALGDRRAALSARAEEERKAIIEEKCAAYIVDKAARLGAPGAAARVSCRAGEDGLLLPERAEIAGPLPPKAREALTAAIWEELGVPPEKQTYYEEALP